MARRLAVDPKIRTLVKSGLGQGAVSETGEDYVVAYSPANGTYLVTLAAAIDPGMAENYGKYLVRLYGPPHTSNRLIVLYRGDGANAAIRAYSTIAEVLGAPVKSRSSAVARGVSDLPVDLRRLGMENAVRLSELEGNGSIRAVYVEDVNSPYKGNALLVSGAPEDPVSFIRSLPASAEARRVGDHVIFKINLS